MLYTSLAVLALSASALASPFSHPFHIHPRLPSTDNRVTVALYNKSNSFRDVRIDGKTYTIQQHELLNVKAPAGTVVYAASRMPLVHRGDILLQLTPAMDHAQITVN